MTEKEKAFSDAVKLAVESIKMVLKIGSLKVIGTDKETGSIVLVNVKDDNQITMLDPRVFNQDVNPTLFYEEVTTHTKEDGK